MSLTFELLGKNPAPLCRTFGEVIIRPSGYRLHIVAFFIKFFCFTLILLVKHDVIYVTRVLAITCKGVLRSIESQPRIVIRTCM